MLSQEDLYLRLKILFTQEPKPLFFYSCKINKTPWQTRCKEGLREWEGTWNKACGLGSAVNQKHGGDTYFLFRQREASESVRQSESTVIHMVLLCCFAWWIPLWYSQESEVNDSLYLLSASLSLYFPYSFFFLYISKLWPTLSEFFLRS